jgi:hypothetical protein
MPKGQVCPEFPIQPSGRVPTVVTQTSLTIWSRKMNHQKTESYPLDLYSELPEFRICLVFEILFLPTVVLCRADSSSLSMRKIP